MICALAGLVGALVAGYFWGNNFLSGGYHSLSWPNGWVWPLIFATLFCFALVSVLSAFGLIQITLGSILQRAALPFILGLIIGVLIFYWMVRIS